MYSDEFCILPGGNGRFKTDISIKKAEGDGLTLFPEILEVKQGYSKLCGRIGAP